jgi:hypothetical protein
MDDRSLLQCERGYELLLEHCAALTRSDSGRTPAVERVEQALGCELTRLLVVALAGRRGARVSI